MRCAILTLLLLLFGVLLASCSSDDALAPGATPSPQPQTIDVDMTIKDFSFDPTTIVSRMGDEVLVRLHNDGQTQHTFTITEFGVDETLESGQDRDVRFTPGEPGEFTFFCRNHPDKMQGTIRIARPGEATSTPASGNNNQSGGQGNIGY